MVSTACCRSTGRRPPRPPVPARRRPAASGLRVSTRQKPHARVHRSPSTMNVAVPAAQHSLRFGHPASSHTVTRPCSRTVFFIASTSCPQLHLRPQPFGLASARCVEPVGTRRPASRRTSARPMAPVPRRARTEPGRWGPRFHATSCRSTGPSPHIVGGAASDDVGHRLHRHVDTLLGQRRDRLVRRCRTARCSRAGSACRWPR